MKVNKQLLFFHPNLQPLVEKYLVISVNNNNNKSNNTLFQKLLELIRNTVEHLFSR